MSKLAKQIHHIEITFDCIITFQDCAKQGSKFSPQFSPSSNLDKQIN